MVTTQASAASVTRSGSLEPDQPWRAPMPIGLFERISSATAAFDDGSRAGEDVRLLESRVVAGTAADELVHAAGGERELVDEIFGQARERVHKHDRGAIAKLRSSRGRESRGRGPAAATSRPRVELAWRAMP